jgi:hypothetical protein
MARPVTATMAATSTRAFSAAAPARMITTTDTDSDYEELLMARLIKNLAAVRQAQQQLQQPILTLATLTNTTTVSQPVPSPTNMPFLWNSAVPTNPTDVGDLSALGRNTRQPKKANHGKRPCSRIGRRKKRRRFGNPRR